MDQCLVKGDVQVEALHRLDVQTFKGSFIIGLNTKMTAINGDLSMSQLFVTDFSSESYLPSGWAQGTTNCFSEF